LVRHLSTFDQIARNTHGSAEEKIWHIFTNIRNLFFGTILYQIGMFF